MKRRSFSLRSIGALLASWFPWTRKTAAVVPVVPVTQEEAGFLYWSKKLQCVCVAHLVRQYEKPWQLVRLTKGGFEKCPGIKEWDGKGETVGEDFSNLQEDHWPTSVTVTSTTPLPPLPPNYLFPLGDPPIWRHTESCLGESRVIPVEEQEAVARERIEALPSLQDWDWLDSHRDI